MPTYSMTPIKSGTRMRTGHDVFASVIIDDFKPTDFLLGDQVWTCPIDGVEARKNDKWLHVTHRNGIELAEKGWTAYIHKGVPVCNNFKEVNPPPTSEPILYPESAIWEYVEPSTGQTKRIQYKFEKVLP